MKHRLCGTGDANNLVLPHLGGYVDIKFKPYGDYFPAREQSGQLLDTFGRGADITSQDLEA
jgi:hypothetical protein